MQCNINIVKKEIPKDTSSVIINNNNIELNIYNKTNSIICRNLNNILKVYTCKTYNFTFSDDIDKLDGSLLISNINDILYSYTNKVNINFNNADYNELYNEYNIYKDIISNPQKTPKTYLEYIKSRIPDNYELIELNREYYPLTQSVANGSRFPLEEKSYMVHIKPKTVNNLSEIYLIGKAITYDSGGMNIKTREMHRMKTDMTGSAILISVLNLLKKSNHNINIIIPIAENMISNTATKPGEIVYTYDKKPIEITNTDAEGRLCMADALIYINQILKPKQGSLILDIATLTGSTICVSDNLSAIVMSNNLGKKYCKKLYKIGEIVHEYVDYLNIRQENMDVYKSSIGFIKNSELNSRSGTVNAGGFLKYFTTDNIPWIHIDIASVVYNNSSELPLSYGILLLYYFIIIFYKKI
jgi:leucyl aminopeptidase